MTASGAAPEALLVAADVAGHLRHLGVEYLIAGSLASSMHGEPRATLDIDLVVALDRERVRAFAERLQSAYYVDAETAREAVEHGTSFNAVHLATAIKVDFFVAGADPFEHERLRRRVGRRIADDPPIVLDFDSPEYTVVRKLEWFRRGGEISERQWRDVEHIVRMRGAQLDHDRMRLWADRLHVGDLLSRLLG